MLPARATLPALLFTGLCLLAGTVSAQNNSERAAIDIVTIEHRAPERVRRFLVDSLDPRGSIGQVDDKLIIATTAGNLAELKQVIEQQDIPPRRVVISVDFDHHATSAGTPSQFSETTVEGEPVEFLAPSSGDPSELTSPALESPAADAPSATESANDSSSPSAPGTDSADPATSTGVALVVSAEVHDGVAATEIEQSDPDGRSLRYVRQLTLSEWHVLDPTSGPPLTAIRVDLLP